MSLGDRDTSSVRRTESMTDFFPFPCGIFYFRWLQLLLQCTLLSITSCSVPSITVTSIVVIITITIVKKRVGGGL